MSASERLLQLYRLRNRVDLEIQAEERRCFRPPAPRAPVRRVSPYAVRKWAKEQGIPVGERGRIGESVWDAYFAVHDA